MYQKLTKNNAQLRELFDQANALSSMSRIPINACLKREDTPIRKDEVLPSLLCEGQIMP